MDKASAGPVTSVLAYCCVDDRTAAEARTEGLRPDADELPVFDMFKTARSNCRGRLLAIDTYAVEVSGGDLRTFVPPSAVANLDPYREAVPVTAAGGIITRHSNAELDVLLIYRRGVWDLPKGKQDTGESVRECGVREVREELGIDDVRIVRGLGETVHGYPNGSEYAVKTTHWFEMKTPERRFNPQAREGIEAAEWFGWREARRRVGYESLRRHMDHVEHLVRPKG